MKVKSKIDVEEKDFGESPFKQKGLCIGDLYIPNETGSWVYIIYNGTYYKIGTTNNIYKRMAQLQTGSHSLLQLVHLEEGDIIRETYLHNKFNHKRVLNEWFNLEEKDLSELKQNCDYNIDIFNTGIKKHTTDFVYLYTNKKQRLHVCGLTPKAKSLLLWIMYEVSYGKEWLWINIERYLLECDVSLNTYKDAVIELCREAIISPILNYNQYYWINPLIFFKGNRAKKYKNKIKIKNNIL